MDAEQRAKLERVARAQRARQSQLAKRKAMPFKVGDMVQCRRDMPFRSAMTPFDPSRRSKMAGKKGEVIGINGEDREVQIKFYGGKSWVFVQDLVHDDDPIMVDEDEILEFEDDAEFEEETDFMILDDDDEIMEDDDDEFLEE